jgi:hypothetical protein
MEKKIVKKYNIIQPEVIVGIGENTEGEDINDHEGISHLHINLEDWLGDDLVEVFPCYLVTEKLKNNLESSQFTGYSFNDVELTKDEYFSDNYQLNKALAKFYWLKINGREGTDDLFIGEKFKLQVSAEFLLFLKSKIFQTDYLDINPSTTENDEFLDELFK